MQTIKALTGPRTKGKARPLVLKSFASLAFDGIQVTDRSRVVSDSPAMNSRSILLLSEDAEWAAKLERAVCANGFAVLRAASVTEAIERRRMACPGASVLDLDLTADAGWQAAAWLLRDATPVLTLLLTAHTDHHELEAAIRSGIVLRKSAEPVHLIQFLNRLAAQSDAERAARALSQQVWLRRARPYRWTEGPPQPCRYWGIND